jgi:hypothetical protein
MLKLQLLVESKQISNNNLILKCSQNVESPERTQIKFDAESDKPVCLFVSKEICNNIKYNIHNYNVADKDVYIYEYTTGNLITKLLKNRLVNQFGTVSPSVSGTSPFLGDIIFPNLNNLPEDIEYCICIDSYLAPFIVQTEKHKKEVIEQDMKRLFEKINNLVNKSNVTFFISSKITALFLKYNISFDYTVFEHENIVDFMLEKLLGKTISGPKSNMIGALEFKGYIPLYISSNSLKSNDTNFNMRTSSVQFSGCGPSEFIVILEAISNTIGNSLSITETISNTVFNFDIDTIPNFEILNVDKYIENIKLIETLINFKNNKKFQEMKDYIFTNIINITTILFASQIALEKNNNTQIEWYIKNLDNTHNKNIEELSNTFISLISRHDKHSSLDILRENTCISQRLFSCPQSADLEDI